MPKRKPREEELLRRPSEVADVEVEDDSVASSDNTKRKLSTASRTSTACDRCRVRKMRCDDQPDGCTPCRLNQTECKTTDRISGKATVRGHVENLERRIRELESHNQQLISRASALGGGAISEESWQGSYTLPLLHWQGAQQLSEDHGSLSVDRKTVELAKSQHGVDPVTTSDPHNRQQTSQRGPSTDLGRHWPSENSLSSTMRGPCITVLGMKIDLAGRTSADVDEPDPAYMEKENPYNKSYAAFMQTAFGSGPKISNVELPPRAETFKLVEMYFRGINPYLPIIHRPTCMQLLSRIFDEAAVPSTAEIVMCHAILAIIYFQLAKRGPGDDRQKAELNASSNAHYHHALGFYSKLLSRRTLADVQALTLLGMHVRNLPKPGASWLLSSTLLNLAIEMGLHRSVKSWPPDVRRPGVLEGEMRKRIFWGILLLHVTISGSLGRPSALRSEDLDAEQPDVIDDELLTDEGIDTSRTGHCNFLVGLQAMRAVPIYMDLYNSIYAVKRSRHNYVDTVKDLDKRIQAWTAQWPRELVRQSASDSDIGNGHARYLEIAPLHVKLLLHHPSLSLTTDSTFNAANLEICLDVSDKMLSHALQLQRLQCLDGTWQTAALYVLATTTTLYGHWEMRDRVTEAMLAKLHQDMRQWLSLISDVSRMLVIGIKLTSVLGTMVERNLDQLSRYVAPKDTERIAVNNSKPLPLRRTPLTYDSHQQQHDQQGPFTPAHHSNVITSTETQRFSHNQQSPYVSSQGVPPHADSISFGNAPSYAYQNTYGHDQNGPDFQHPTFPPAGGMSAIIDDHSAYPQSYQHNPAAPGSYQPLDTYPNSSEYGRPRDQSSWKQHTSDMNPGMNPHPHPEYMSSASALIQLGRPGTQQTQHDLPMAVGMLAGPDRHEADAPGVTSQNWPYLLYDDTPPGG